MVQLERNIVTVRLEELLGSLSKPQKNYQHIIFAKLADLVSDSPAKLIQESIEHNRIKYRFCPYLVDDTDTGNIASVDTHSPLKQENNNSNTATSVDPFWSDGEKSGDPDLISFDKEDDDPLASILSLNVEQQQIHSHDLASPAAKTTFGKPSSPKPQSVNSQGMTTTVYHYHHHHHPHLSSSLPPPPQQQHQYVKSAPSPKVPLFIPSLPQHKHRQKQLTKRSYTYASSPKVPLFRPAPQQRALSMSTADDIKNRIAEKLDKHASFKLPTKSAVTIKRPVDTNINNNIKDESPSFNANAAPFIPSSPASPASSSASLSSVNIKAAPFTPRTASTIPEENNEKEPSSASSPTTTIYNVKAAPFIPTTNVIDDKEAAATTSSLLDIHTAPTSSTGAGGDDAAPHDPPATLNAKASVFTPSLDTNQGSSESLNAMASVFTPSLGTNHGSSTSLDTNHISSASLDTNHISSSSLNVKASVFTPSFDQGSSSTTVNADPSEFPSSLDNNNNNNDDDDDDDDDAEKETTVETDLITLNVMAMPFMPTTATAITTGSRSSNSSSSVDEWTTTPQLNPSAPSFEPTISFSPSLSSPLLHLSSTSSCTTDDDHHYDPTTHKTAASSKSDTSSGQQPSETDLVDLTMESFTDRRVGW